jgi:hypothetical protein
MGAFSLCGSEIEVIEVQVHDGELVHWTISFHESLALSHPPLS